MIANPMHVKDCAPIALFVYSRPEHTRRTVEALQANALAERSDLFVFADAAKHNASTAAVQAVREYIRGLRGFRSINCVERDRNLGLSNSIIAGVTQLCDDYGRAVVIEDDILTAPDFLTFMNRGLERHACDPRVFSIGGFNYPVRVPEDYPYDAFYAYRFACWGWGTWRDRWQRADWRVADYANFRRSRTQRERLNYGGDDLCWLLGQHMSGRVDSWDTVWAYTHAKHDAVSFLPVISKSKNIGLDGSGVHCRRSIFEQTALCVDSAEFSYRFPDSIVPDPHFNREIRKLHHRSVVRNVGRYLYGKLGLR